MEAFAHSCNTTFAKTGLILGKGDLRKASEDLLFNSKLPTELSHVKKSSFTMDDKADDALVMQTAIGQGDTLVTPLHMAMIASAVCQGGEVMEPYYLDHVVNNNDTLVRKFAGGSAGTIMTVSEAKKLKKYMRHVVTEGTASALNTSAYKAYGKTGSAEYTADKNKTHSWFVGFAKKDGKKIAVAIIMEGAGSGSSHAVPLAKKMFEAYF